MPNTKVDQIVELFATLTPAEQREAMPSFIELSPEVLRIVLGHILQEQRPHGLIEPLGLHQGGDWGNRGASSRLIRSARQV